GLGAADSIARTVDQLRADVEAVRNRIPDPREAAHLQDRFQELQASLTGLRQSAGLLEATAEAVTRIRETLDPMREDVERLKSLAATGADIQNLTQTLAPIRESLAPLRDDVQEL